VGWRWREKLLEVVILLLALDPAKKCITSTEAEVPVKFLNMEIKPLS